MEQQDMRIKQATYFTSMASVDRYPGGDLPEVDVVGKSNVGKSSLINAVSNNFKLAKTSSKPGKTRMINFFLINRQIYLVDLPGYGFSRASKAEMEQWGKLIEGYFALSKQLRHLLLLVDCRHDPSAGDKDMCAWLRYYKVPFTVVATKCDKLSKAQLPRHIKNIRTHLELDKQQTVISFSTQGRLGCTEVAEVILSQAEKE